MWYIPVLSVKSVSFRQGSIYELPVPNRSVDCILGVMIAQFIDLPQLFEEAKRVLKPGGALVFHGKCDFKVVEIERETEYKSESETATTVSELNQRIFHIRTELFSGLFHDRTTFNPHKYTNIPPLYPNQEAARKEWKTSYWSTIPQLADYILTWSAAGKYCVKHSVSSGELRGKLVEMLGAVGVVRVRCEADKFTWCSVNCQD